MSHSLAIPTFIEQTDASLTADRPLNLWATNVEEQESIFASAGQSIGRDSTQTTSNRIAVRRTVADAGAQASRAAAIVKPLAEWQGHVTKVEADNFVAMLDGVYGYGVIGQTQEAKIPLREVSPEDMPLLREGAYFRLSVSYTISRGGSGTAQRTSGIAFRRLPVYQESDLESARETARALIGGLRLE